MENPQAQMPQGQPGMEQGQAPQQGGQDQQMQQLLQAVQQMIQQGAQPIDVAAELLGQQVPPEVIMQVFVQMGLPEQDAQMAIEQAMQGGQQPQSPGEEQMEGAASNPQEEAQEMEGAPMPPEMQGQPQMAFGGFFSGNTARRLKNKKNVVINNYTINGQPAEDENFIGGGYAPDAETATEADVYYNPGLRTSVGNAMFPNNGNASTPPMRNGGMLRRYENGSAVDPNQELQTVMEQVQGMMEQGADARQVMEQIQAAAQQGDISPEVATQVLEQLSGMQQAQDPQGSDMAMTDGSQDPQVPTPGVAAPEAQMMKFGGNLRKLMQKAYGGNAIPPSLDSKNYAQERANMFVTSVKNNAFKASLDDEFPSLSGNNMAYGGNLPKAVDGISMKDGKLAIDPSVYKSEADYKAAVYDWNTNPANKDNQVTTELFTANKWTQQPDANASYKYDPATKQYIKQEAPKTTTTTTNQFQFQEGDVLNRDAQGAYVTRKDGSMMRVPASFNQGAAYNVSQSQINPVQYQDPRGNSLYDQLYMSANPWARLIAGSGDRGYDPRITGSNLPGGMSGAQFLGAIGGVDKLTSGMTGTVGNQTWRLGEAEKFKEGSIWKGNRRKGVRYKIDWGDAAAFNTPAGPQNQPQQPLISNNAPSAPVNPSIAASNAGVPVMGPNNQPLTSDGSNLMWNSGNMPTLQNPNPGAANQNLINPANTNVIQPASEVNNLDQGIAAVGDGSNMMWNSGNMPTLQNPNPQGNQPELFPSLIPGSKEMVSKDAVDFQKSQMDRGLEWNPQKQTWAPNAQMQNVANLISGNTTKPQDLSGLANTSSSGTANYADSNPKSSAPDKPVAPTEPTAREIRQDKRSLKRDMRKAGRSVRNMLNDAADQSDMPEVMQQAFQQQAYGGQIYRAMGGEGDCPEGMMWSEEQQACVPAAEPKPLEGSVSIGNEGGNQFSANYSGAVGPTGIATNQFGVGFKNNSTDVNANYDAANRSIMLQGQKTWNVGNGQLGVSGGYTAPVGGGGFNQGNFNGNVFYNTELGKGDKAVPVKVNFGIGQQAYGGSVNPQDLANAVALINRAFGGMMPRANNGLDLGSEDANGNKIPDYLEASSLPGNTNNKDGYLEASEGKKFKVDWNAAADVYATSGAKFANFMDKVSSFQGNQERELAKRSALNRPSDTYDTMEQGVYDQWGNFKPNDLNNQVLNPTDVYRQNQRQVFAYGGRLYEIGGEVELDDNELAALTAAGLKIRRA